MPNPALCTESIDQALTLGTFRLFIQAAGGTEQEVGNIETGSFQYTPNILEHRRGIDNSLDALFALGRDYIINFTTDAITAQNLAALLNEDPVNTIDGCKIPLTGNRCVRAYGARLLHLFPCESEGTLEVIFWRAAILSEFTLNFEREAVATVQGVIKALNCASAHPTEPYGTVTLFGTCPAS
jgi:hypothetical protein